MPTAPTILPTQITEGQAPGLSYRLEGELVPVLHMALDGQVPVYFEHHVLLWKYPTMQIGLHPLKKGLKRRVFGGMPLLLLEAQSAGEIAFSRDAPGHIAALHLQSGEGIMVREHQFLAATGNVQYDYSRIKGFANMMYGGGFFVDQFYAADHEGVVWVHGYGNVFEKNLEAGETIDIEPGGWVYRDHSVQMAQEVYGFKTGLLGGGGGNLVFNRFTGPGRVGLQSAYYHPPVPEGSAASQQQSGGRARRHRRRPAGQLMTEPHRSASHLPGYLAAHPLPPGSSARSGSAATSCWPTSAASARAGSARRRSCWSRPTRTRRCPTPARRSRCTTRSCATSSEASAFIALAAQLGYLRLSGYRLALERHGLRIEDPLSTRRPAAIAAEIPDKHPGGGCSVAAAAPAAPRACWRPCARCRRPARRRISSNPELLRGVLLALALRDESVGGAEAAELADRALPLTTGDGALDPPAALEAAKSGG